MTVEVSTVAVTTAGPQGPRGVPGWVWRGEWSPGVAYAAEVVTSGAVTAAPDAVHHDGRSWVALAGSTGVEPGTDGGTVWSIAAERGEDNSLVIGTVTTGAPGSQAAATITGAAPEQTLNLTIPAGAAGVTNSLAIGTVTTGAPGSQAAATITGAAPEQTLNLTIPAGAAGPGLWVVTHGADAATARPAQAAAVCWQGSVQPANIAAGDLWIVTP